MKIEWIGEQMLNKISGTVDMSLLTCAADLQDRSVNRAPIDSGKLRENCVVDESEIGDHSVKVGYSHQVDDYSLVQHERLDFNHPRGGEAKYLENPFNENAYQYIDKIGRDIGRGIK